MTITVESASLNTPGGNKRRWARGRSCMMTEVDRTGTVEGLHQAMHRVMAVPGIQVMLVLSCSANEFTPDAADVMG